MSGLRGGMSVAVASKILDYIYAPSDDAAVDAVLAIAGMSVQPRRFASEDEYNDSIEDEMYRVKRSNVCSPIGGGEDWEW